MADDDGFLTPLPPSAARKSCRSPSLATRPSTQALPSPSASASAPGDAKQTTIAKKSSFGPSSKAAAKSTPSRRQTRAFASPPPKTRQIQQASNHSDGVVEELLEAFELLDLEVRFTIIGARGLRNADLGGEPQDGAPNLSDPYCSVEIKEKPGMKFNTRTILDTLTPVWNTTFMFHEWEPLDKFYISVWDRDDADQDDFLGGAYFTSQLFDEEGSFYGELLLEGGGGTRHAFAKMSVQVVEATKEGSGRPIKELALAPVARQPEAIQSLQAESMEVQEMTPDASCRLELVDCDLFHWEIALSGPTGTPYEGGTFCFSLRFPVDYPTQQPLVRCITPVFHCNIDENGNICPSPVGAAHEDDSERLW